MTYAELVSVAICTLTLARSNEELDQWWRLNLTWIQPLKTANADQYARLIEACRETRARVQAAPTSKTASSMRR